MKNLLSLIVVVMVVSSAYADHGRHGNGRGHGHHNGNVVGAVLTGLVGAAIVSDIMYDRNYDRRTVVYETVPVGHYETVYEQVWIPGETYKVWVPEQRVWNNYEITVYQAHYEYKQAPGHYETIARQVWVNGY